MAHRFRIIDYSHAYRLVFEYIEAFYNTVRIHSHCGYHSPCEYEKQYLDKMEAQEFREEMLTELDDLEDMVAENSGIGFH